MKKEARLKEGYTYIFKCLKVISLSGEDFYVLKSPAGGRHLLPSSRYSKYGIESGKNVVCRVDRINCKNEIFLEPEHPVYREGETYSFPVAGTTQEMDEKGAWWKTVWVEDVLGNQIALPEKTAGKISEGRVRLKILKIKKGLPHMATAE